MNALFIELGSTIELPQYYEFHNGLQNPDDYKNLFIQSIRKGVSFMNTIGVSSAIKSPKLPTFVSLSPVESSWTGLQSIIPNLLTMGITGFSFIMTGPIGGSYKRASQLPRTDPTSTMSVFEANKPDRNLYIRWLELTYFLPIVQYTYLPSDYDSHVLEIARYHKQLRESKVQSIIKKAIDESLTQGTAIIQPLWMIDPHDVNCLVVSDQFTIGGQIMVAPILQPNSTERDIYLPKGKWKDELYGTTTKGEKWLHRYPVREHQIAFFTKMYDGFS
jgi:alpha-glucosidase (family GH31 glycosyl hydrolase)